jgi:hypothetical protein
MGSEGRGCNPFLACAPCIRALDEGKVGAGTVKFNGHFCVFTHCIIIECGKHVQDEQRVLDMMLTQCYDLLGHVKFLLQEKVLQFGTQKLGCNHCMAV